MDQGIKHRQRIAYIGSYVTVFTMVYEKYKNYE